MSALRVLGIIPARGGSKRVPGKNLRLLGGKPLVVWAMEAARAAKRLERLVVSSDDAEILKLAAQCDARFPLSRPAEMSNDESPAIDYVRHALATLEAAGERPFDAVAIVQPTSPFTTSADIDGTIELMESAAADSAVSVMQIDHAIHPLKMKVMEGDRLLPLIEEEQGRMAAHELPNVFVRNCSVYVARRSLIESGRIIGDDCRGYVMPRERSLDINDETDFDFAEFLLVRKEDG